MAKQGIYKRLAFWLAIIAIFVFCFAFAAVVALYPQADGTVVYQNKGTTVDASHADQGYVMVQHTQSTKKLKMRIMKGASTSTYDLSSEGNNETFPLSFGSGDYKLQVFAQVSGTRYTNDSSVSFSVEISDETLPFLYPNQYVWYTAQSATVLKGDELCAGIDTDEDRLAAIRAYVVKNIIYDYVLAATVQTGYLPVVDDVLASGKGICFDYAALMACMLRTQGIPAKLVIGYADTVYHAWNSVLIDGEWQHVDATAEANHMNVKQYTEERIY